MRLWPFLFVVALWACDDGDPDPEPTPDPDAAPIDVFIPMEEDAAPIEEDVQIPDAQIPDAALDEDGPRIIFDRPGDSERIEGEVIVTLKVRDVTGVARVTLSVEDEEVIAFEAEPYEWTWDTRDLVEGPYRLKAMAWDTLGNTSEEEITVNVRSACGDDCPPRGLGFIAPEDGATVCGPLQIEVEATDDVGVASVELQVDRTPITGFDAPPYRFDWDTTSVDDGEHELRMVAVDTSGQQAEKAISINISNSEDCDNPPTVEFIAPVEGAFVSGIVPISVLALDDNEIKSVTFFVDGERRIEDATGPYGFDLYTAEMEAGEHTVMARAEDRSDQRTSAELTVLVDQVDPLIELVTPEIDAVIEGDVVLEAEVSDDNGVAQVRFRVEAVGAPEGEGVLRDEILEAPPWTLTIPEGELPNAPLLAHAAVTDVSGRIIEVEPVPFTADPAPVLRFASPEPNARVEGAVEVRVETEDDLGFADITFSVDGAALGPFVDERFDWTPQYWMGERTLRAEGVTLSGQTVTANLTVVVDHPLIVTLNHCVWQPSAEEGGEDERVCAPIERDVELRDGVEVSVETEDDDGTIQEIRLLMDDEEIARRGVEELEVSGRDFGFDAWVFEDGQRALAAVALSDNGAETTLEVSVQINNCDRDHDNHDDDSRACGGLDCDDTNDGIKPGAAETCEGVDDNCDGLVDEGCGVAPTVSSVAFYVSEGVLGLEVEGNDPDGDVDRVSIELFDENGGAIPMRGDGAEGAVVFALDAVEALDEEGNFRGVWSGAGPLASNALVAVGDASGEMSDARVSIARAPTGAALGGACDPYGGVSVCPDATSCLAWICAETPAAQACAEAEEIPEIEGGGGWLVEGDTLDYGDDSRGSCGGGDAEDRLHLFFAPEAGTYQITIEVAEGDAPLLYARARCDLEDLEAELSCGDALQVDLPAGEPTYIYVDGQAGWSGLYALRVTPL